MGSRAEWPFPNLSLGWGHPDVLDSNSKHLGRSPRFCISNELPGGAAGAHPQTTFSRATSILSPGGELWAGPSVAALGPGINCGMHPLPLWCCPTPCRPPNLGCLDLPPQREPPSGSPRPSAGPAVSRKRRRVHHRERIWHKKA